MSYVQNGLIEAVDFNTFRTQLLDVYGVGFGDSGYGQTAITVPTVLGGFVEIVKSAEWTNFRNAVEVCALHQGTATTLLPPVTVLEPGDVVIAHDGITDPDDFPQMLTDITNNRLIADPTSTSLFLNRSVQSITQTWSNLASTVIDLEWPSADDARYYFNSGGEVIVRSEFSPTSSTPQNDSWQSLLNDVGSVITNYITTTYTGTVGTPASIGYYNMTTAASPDLLFSAGPPSGGGYYYYYNVNQYRISARMLNVSGINGDNGRRMRLLIEFDDQFTGAGDVVDGTLTVRIDERRATTHLTVPSFTVNVQTALNAS